MDILRLSGHLLLIVGGQGPVLQKGPQAQLPLLHLLRVVQLLAPAGGSQR
jgi:hypothetical protein